MTDASHQQKRHDRLSLALGVVAIVAMALFLVLRLEVTTDITHFLPSLEDKRLAQMAKQLAESDLTRTMVLSVGAADPQLARAGARDLAAALRKHPEVEFVEQGPDPRVGDAFWQLYQPRRLLLLAGAPETELPARLSDPGLHEAAKDLKRQLGLPTAPLIKQVAPADPLLAFPGLLRRLEAARPAGLRIEEDQFLSADGQRAILFLATRHSALDAETQAPLLEAINHEFAQIQHGRHLTLQQSGINRFAVQSRHDIETDVKRISTLSTVTVAIVFIAMFRSVPLFFVAQLPIFFALLVGAATTLAVFGRMHGLTLAFGSTLIGVCIDYPIHFLNHHTLVPHPDGPKAGLRRIWTGLWLGAATTVAGFAGLGWSTYPGIREVAVFASAGITAALLATRWWLPLLVPDRPKPVALQQRAAKWLGELMDGLRDRRKVLFGLLAAAAAVAVAGLPGMHWNDDLAALNALDPQLKAEDDAVRQQVSTLEPGRLVVVRAPDLETALQRNDRVAQRLELAKSQGVLADFRSLHTFLWSADLQRRNLAQLQKDPQLPARLQAAFTAEGLRGELFAPFAQALAEPATPLTWPDLAASPVGHLVRTFHTRLGPDQAFLTFLNDVHDPVALQAAIADVPGATFFDQRAFVNKAYADYRSTTWGLVLIGVLLILGLVAVRYRSWALTTVACAPAVLAGGATLGLLSLCGESLNLLHLVGFVLVLSMGVDYGVYLAETAQHPESEPATVLSIVLACLSTVLGFGLLGMSANPALRAVGLTTGVGVLLSLILAPTLLLLTSARRPNDTVVPPLREPS